MFAESRLQLRWQSDESSSATQLPTVQRAGCLHRGRRAAGRRTDEPRTGVGDQRRLGEGEALVRAGALVEGGRFRSDSRTNYLGTYTFASLADYEAGRPSTYSRRVGDPLVEYSQWQAGLFIQDDWRARKNLTRQRGSARGAPDAPRRQMEPLAACRPHLVAVPKREDHRPRRRRDLLRLARRGDLRADPARRRRAAAGPA